MSDLKTEYLLSMYEEVLILGNKERCRTWLVKHRTTGQLFVKKIMAPAKAPVYQYLKAHPHPNLVPVHTVLQTPSACITIEEYISGRTLDALLHERCPLAEAEVCQYIRQLCQALHHVHQVNIIHRDIHPHNIIISSDNILKLIDFDISRTLVAAKSSDTTILGTAGYAAPEQFGFSQTDVRADIYSAGVLMNVMLTGGFPNTTLYNNPRIRRIISKCTEMDAKNRYQNIMSLNRDLERFVPDSRPVETQPPRSGILRSIPGFRTGSPWKILIAVLGYPFMLSISFTDLKPFIPYGLPYVIPELIGLLLFIHVPFILFSNPGYFDRKLPLFSSLSIKQARALRIGLAIVSICLGSVFMTPSSSL